VTLPTIPTAVKARWKAVAGAVLGAVVPYVIAARDHHQAVTLVGLEDAALGALLVGFGVHATTNTKLTRKQRAKLRANPILPTGKAPARRDDRDLRFADYLTTLPPTPSGILGHFALIVATLWGMLGNALWGDCVWAGADHETMLWTTEAGDAAVFVDANALADYSAVTGFNPNDPSSDQGTDVRDSYTYRMKTGVIDAAGNRHKLGAYLNVDLDVAHLARAIYLFGVVGLGIEFPESAMDQFNAGEPWDVVPGTPKPTDGHYIPLVGYDPTKGYWYVVTWGKLQPVTTAFLLKYADEHYALLSPEMLKNGASLEGFDLATLQGDLKAINNAVTPPSPTPTPAPTPTPTPTPVPAASVVVDDPALVAKITQLATEKKQTPKVWLAARLHKLYPTAKSSYKARARHRR
jgi:hypothetical protein